MGKNKEKKKKGLGMEKTLAKTEKKIQKNLKKELQEIGEDDIEKLIADFNEKEKQLNQVKEEHLPSGRFPSRRGGSTFNLLPEKDELILFGGDYYNGKKVAMFNDLYVYSIKKSQWTLIKAPNGPPPRTFHQSVVVSRNGGELWVFGGEFSSPTQSQFYHYNDLWCFNFQSKQWAHINAPNGPSPRSGHRMVVLKKHLIVFGGYYDNLRNCKFYNDVHVFNLETNQWEEVKYSTTGLSDQPSPRSACQLAVCAKTNQIIMYGGYCREQLKKEKEKGITHSDMFILTQEVKKNDKIEWFWKRVKQGGLKPSERVSFSMVTINDDTALLFGGVYDLKDDDDEVDDDEDEEKANSVFFNDLYKLDLSSHKWTQLKLKGKREIKAKKTTKAENEMDVSVEETNDEEMNELEEPIEQLSLKEDQQQPKQDDDDPFKVTYSKSEDTSSVTTTVVQNEEVKQDVFMPHPRRSSYIQYHKGILYLYGGKFEDADDKEITLNDMYSLNVKKLDEWNLIYEDPEFKLELKKSAESEDDEEMKRSGDEEDDDSDFEIDAPKPNLPDETIEEYFTRTNEIWLEEAAKEFPEEKSKKFIKKVARELCQMFWDNFKQNSNQTECATASASG